MFRVTGVVKHLLIINILMYFGTILLMGEGSYGQTEVYDWGRYKLALFFPNSPFFQPYQIVTHMFMHAGMMHLFFNMFALFMFGPSLEASWGPKKFLQYYFITGLGAMILHILVRYLELEGMPPSIYERMLGASGSVFGLLAGYGMLFPNNRLMLLIPPIPIKAKYFVLIYAALELYLGLSPFSTGIAHFAHLGGALFGVLLILYWRKT